MARHALYGDLAEQYDLLYAGKPYREEVEELTRRIRREGRRGSRTLLDVGCGTGRHLKEFARRFDVAGVDASAAMLRIARRRLGPRVPLRRGDMRSFDLGRRFDAIVCLFSAIGYLLTRADRDRALANFYRHLAPGGMVLVEGWIRPSRWRDGFVSLLSYDTPELKLARVTTTRRAGQRSFLRMEYLVAAPGRPVRHVVERHVNALIPPEEMLGSFRRAGFAARVDWSGRYRDRGLFIGVRPPTRP